MSSVAKESRLLAKHSVIYGVGTATNKLVAFLLLPIYTQFLSTHDYGIKELVGLSTDIIGTLMATAISSAFFRFYFDNKEQEKRDLVLSSSYISLGGFGFLCVALLSLFTPIMAELILDSSTLYTYFLISFAAMWFQIMNSIGFNLLRADLKSVQYIVFTIARLITAICLNIIFIIYFEMGVLGILISTLLTSIAIFIFLNIPQLLRVGFHLSLPLVKDMFRFGFPLIWSQLGAFVVHLSDRFFIKAYSSISDVGLYSLGYRFGTLPGTFISEPFNQVWQPRRLELFKQENSEEMFGRVFTYFLLLLTFVGLGVAILTKDVLIVISDQKFWSAYKIVPIIVLANTIFSFHYHFNMGLIIEKKTKYLGYINFSNGLLVLLLNFLLIPRFGIYGAAYATLIAFIYKVVLTYYFSSRYFRIHFEFNRISILLLASVIVYTLSLGITISNVILSLIIKTGLVCLFPGILYLMDFFTLDEKIAAKSFLQTKLHI